MKLSYAGIAKSKIKSTLETDIQQLATKIIGSDSYSCSRMDIENDMAYDGNLLI